MGAAVRCAEAARSTARGVQARFISLDIGPLGRLLAPFGDLDFDTAYEAFSRLVRIGTSFGVDLVTVETMTTTLEAKAALLAVRDNTELPVMVTLAFSEDGKTMQD